MTKALDDFLESLRGFKGGGNVFNPWTDFDLEADDAPESPNQRFGHLKNYLSQRMDSARYLLIAEAPGYNGCKFSGLAMTSERMLIDSEAQGALFSECNPYFTGEKKRTSKVALNRRGMTEPTATIVWGALHDFGCDPYRWVTWNAFAWHPHHPGQSLSNRTPTDGELNAGMETLELFMHAFPDRKIVAIGNKSESVLGKMGATFVKVRHPANGGAGKFRTQVAEAMAACKA